MWNCFQLTVFLFTIILTQFTAEASLTARVPLAAKIQSLPVVKPDADVPICYMKTSDGSILNLSSLCKQEHTNSSTRSNQTFFNPYKDSQMKKSDDELYGKEN